MEDSKNTSVEIDSTDAQNNSVIQNWANLKSGKFSIKVEDLKLGHALVLNAEQRSYRNLVSDSGTFRNEAAKSIVMIEATCNALAELSPSQHMLEIGGQGYRVEDYIMPHNLIVSINASHVYMNADSEDMKPVFIGSPFSSNIEGKIPLLTPTEFNSFFARYNSGQRDSAVVLEHYQKVLYVLSDVGACVVKSDSNQFAIAHLNNGAAIDDLVATNIRLQSVLGITAAHVYLEQCPTDLEVKRWVIHSSKSESAPQ